MGNKGITNQPAEVTPAQPVGVLTVQESPTAEQELQVFFLGSDGHLWRCKKRYSDIYWQWENMGQPAPNVSLVKPVGVFTVQDSPAAPQRAHAFVLGSDGNLWVRYDSGPLGWLWRNLGAPPRVGLAEGVGALNITKKPGAPPQLLVSLKATDGNLWTCVGEMTRLFNPPLG